MIGPHPIWGLPGMVPVAHTGGPPAYPTRRECGICRRFRRAVAEAEEAAARESENKSEGAAFRAALYLNNAAGYRKAEADHLERVPHKGA
ncbi:hypothetical protein ACFQ2B_28240 [Streptomyces stramineus]|uniref:Uncharacterized protein n=1 Tax=Streptomyces stramineus TaxID=173861 RepID=A0ABN1AL09_9ACTN